MTTIWYSSSFFEDPCRHQLNVGYSDPHRPVEQKYIAELCADDFHSNHDGWEAYWPRDITLYLSEDGPALASFTVDREAVPQFTAFRKAQGAEPSTSTRGEG